MSHTVFTIAVSDIDEFDVTTPVDDDSALNSVAENADVDTVVGITALASDADGTTNTVTYSLVSDAGGLFKIHSTTGVVSVASTALNYETATSHSITVRATSADTSTKDSTFTINVLDLDEFDVTAPVDTDTSADSVAENVTVGTLVGIDASASDADGSNNTVTYSLESASGTADAGRRFRSTPQQAL